MNPNEALNAHLLATLECPYHERCELTGARCPFAHRRPATATTELPTDDLRPIPWYYCMDHLLSRCQSIEMRRSNLVRCEFGFHPTNADLEDHDLFVSKMASMVLTGHFASVRISSKCATCQQNLSGVCVLLERCSHRYCIRCYNRDFQPDNTILGLGDFVCRRCPVTSKRVMVWPNAAISQTYQQLLFSLQRRAFGLMTGRRSHALVRDQLLTEEGGGLTIRYQKDGRTPLKKYFLTSRDFRSTQTRQQSPAASAAAAPSTQQANPVINDECSICLRHISASPGRLWAYLENCPHRFCIRCLLHWREQRALVDPLTRVKSIEFNCPTCRTKAARILIWPSSINIASFQKELFSCQKKCFGLWVSPQTSISIHEAPRLVTDNLVFICNSIVWLPSYSIAPAANNQN